MDAIESLHKRLETLSAYLGARKNQAQRRRPPVPWGDSVIMKMEKVCQYLNLHNDYNRSLEGSMISWTIDAESADAGYDESGYDDEDIPRRMDILLHRNGEVHVTFWPEGGVDNMETIIVSRWNLHILLAIYKFFRENDNEAHNYLSRNDDNHDLTEEEFQILRSMQAIETRPTR
jgi:hypothetical protein